MPKSPLTTRAFFAAVSLSALSLAACTAGGPAPQSSDAVPQSDNQPTLAVTTGFYPLTFVAERVGAEHVAITDLTPGGGEAHDLELSPRQVVQISASDMVYYLGGGFQPALEDALSQATVAANALDAIPVEDRIEGDPHVWLDPRNIAAMGDQMAELLSQLAPESAAVFRENAEVLRKDMDELSAAYEEGLAGCRGATLVTSHQAFGYLAAAYGLQQVGIAGIDPEAEPSPKRLTEVQSVIDQNDVTTVFVESSAMSQQRLTDALTVEVRGLSTLESSPADGDYLTVMRENLAQLEAGLNCG